MKCGVVRSGKAGKVSQRLVGRGLVWQARRVRVRCGMARQAWNGFDWQVTVWQGRLGGARQGKVWCGNAGKDRPGTERSGNAGNF